MNDSATQSAVDKFVDGGDRVREIDRIIGLPDRDVGPESDRAGALADEYTARFQRPGSDRDLLDVQGLALAELEAENGLLANINVGGGKTLIALLAGDVLGADPYKTVILHPADTRCALLREAKRQFEHFDFDPRVYALSYHQLSQPGGWDRLTNIEPDLIVADEAHKLGRRSSARTKRVIRYFKSRPSTVFTAMSGTLTSKGLSDYAHLAELALRDGSPLPRAHNTLQRWSACIDVEDPYNVPVSGYWQELQPLVDEYGPQLDDDLADQPYGIRRKKAREAYLSRFASTPGVVVTQSESVEAALRLRPQQLEIPPAIESAMREARKSYKLPGGEEIESPLELADSLRQLSAGFYYRWDWPNDEPDRAWLRARRDWKKAIRHVVRHGKQDYDSPAKARAAIRRGEYDYNSDIESARDQWDRHKHKPTPDREPVWIDDYLLDAAIGRAESLSDQGRSVLVWYHWRAVADRLEQKGLKVCQPDGIDPETLHGGCPAAVSEHAHGRGLNLQSFDSNIVLTPSPTGKVWEQQIGRTHRRGQPSDTVLVDIYIHNEYARQNVESAREDARYMRETQRQPQKILYGDWTSTPFDN